MNSINPQNEFEKALRGIYFKFFHEEISKIIETRIQLLDSEDVLFKGDKFIVVDSPSKWIKTEAETFVWYKTVKLLTPTKLEETIFVSLDLRGFQNPMLCLWFPMNDFKFDYSNKKLNIINDHTFFLTNEMVKKYGLDKFIIKPFDLEV
jgi:hypothetical protein